MTNGKFDALFGGPPRKPEELLTPAPHGSRRFDPGGDRGGRAAPHALARARRPAPRISASPAASRSTASPTARCCATASSSASGSSRRPATPAARSARRSRPTTCMRISRGALERQLRWHARRLSRARVTATTNVERACTSGGRPVRACLATSKLIEQTPRAPRRRQGGSAGSRAAWSSARARSAPARSSAIRARRRCRRCSTSRSNIAKVFRPFAPAVLREDVADWFELDADSPYMLLVADVADAAGAAR